MSAHRDVLVSLYAQRNQCCHVSWLLQLGGHCYGWSMGCHDARDHTQCSTIRVNTTVETCTRGIRRVDRELPDLYFTMIGCLNDGVRGAQRTGACRQCCFAYDTQTLQKYQVLNANHKPGGCNGRGNKLANPSTSSGSLTNVPNGSCMRAVAFHVSHQGPPPTSTAALLLVSVAIGAAPRRPRLSLRHSVKCTRPKNESRQNGTKPSLAVGARRGVPAGYVRLHPALSTP